MYLWKLVVMEMKEHVICYASIYPDSPVWQIPVLLNFVKRAYGLTVHVERPVDRKTPAFSLSSQVAHDGEEFYATHHKGSPSTLFVVQVEL